MNQNISFKKCLGLVAVAPLIFSMTTAVLADAQNPQYYSTHGTACQPANLAQAINRGMGWNKDGVRNPNPEGGQSFFVACPVVYGDDGTSETTDTADDDIYIGYEVKAITTAVDLSCSGYWQDSGGLINSVSNTVSLSTADTRGSFTLNDLVDENLSFFQANLQGISVVCNLPPQVGIIWLGMDYD